MLYQLTEDIKNIKALIEEDDSHESLDKSVDDYLADLGEALQSKVEGYVMLIRELKSKADARSAEASRLKESSDLMHNAAMRLQNRLKERLEECGEKTVQTNLFNVRVCANGGKLPLELHEDDVPHDFKEASWKPDTGKIRQILESCAALPFARLGERKTHLRIK